MSGLSAETLAQIFGGLMALAVLLYAILDGYDLGVGVTLPMDNEAWRDRAIASIGPFWDANETWLVLAIGLLLVAFPEAHSMILKALYLPASLLLIGLILRGVAFDFRAKVKPEHKRVWDWLFKIGSLIATASQGFMLGIYVMGLEYTTVSVVFASLSAFGVTAAYALIGNTWLIMKTDGDLQKRSIGLSKLFGALAFGGIVAVCMINPLVNPNVYQIWTTPPLAYVYAAIPLLCFAMLVLGYQVLKRLPLANHAGDWVPFSIAIIIFTCCFIGLALSFYPYVVPNTLTLYQAASAQESLSIILIGASIVVPVILIYTGFVYYAFRGKATDLRYH